MLKYVNYEWNDVYRYEGFFLLLRLGEKVKTLEGKSYRKDTRCFKSISGENLKRGGHRRLMVVVMQTLRLITVKYY